MERRYNDDEVARIFERAAESESAEVLPTERAHGMTLSEIQAVGAEVGLPPDRISSAAAELDAGGGGAIVSRAFGRPIAVRHAVPLPRAPTDEEWEIILSDVRATFNAQGRTASSGPSRQWRNGNLHVVVEPTADGFRLRMGTRKGGASGQGMAGAILLVVGLIILASEYTAGIDGGEIASALAIALTGAALLGSQMLSLPAWAEKREDQMREIAARTTALLERPAEP